MNLRKLYFIIVLIMVVLTLGCQKQVTVSFEMNGAKPIESIELESDGIISDLPIPVRDGHYFKEWYVDEELKERFNKSEKLVENTTLYAQWEKGSYNLNVHFDDTNIDQIKLDYNAEIPQLNDISKDGYTFGGWYVGKTLIVEFTYKTMPSQDLDIFPKWIPNQHLINFNTNGGKPVEPILFDFGKPLSQVNSRTSLTDSTFLGWYLDSKFTKPASKENMPNSNITLYAKWKNYQIVQKNNKLALSILRSYGCNSSVEQPDRCSGVVFNRLSIDFNVFRSNIVCGNWMGGGYNFGNLYDKYIYYESLDSTPKYYINNKTAPASEFEDFIARLPKAIEKIKEIESKFAANGLEQSDLCWP